jgi:dTMP kinase
MTSSKGRFITIEGGEGVGKSLFQEMLAKDLTAVLGPLGLITTREPGGTPAADQIRSLFGNPPAQDAYLMETEAFLVSAARAQHVGRLIRPALQRGTWVLCDRFADSTRVYQGKLGNLDEAMIESLISLSTQRLEPDLTFLLDCDVQLSQSRLTARSVQAVSGEKSDPIIRYDEAKKSFHERLRQGYLALLPRFPQRIVRLDAALPVARVVKDAKTILAQRFPEELGSLISS